MGSSAKKEKEKKKDFQVSHASCLHQSITNSAQKTKLKVGKTKAKPDNFTDTSFRAKSTQPAPACTCI